MMMRDKAIMAPQPLRTAKEVKEAQMKKRINKFIKTYWLSSA
jgi:hypothetical protein